MRKIALAPRTRNENGDGGKEEEQILNEDRMKATKKGAILHAIRPLCILSICPLHGFSLLYTTLPPTYNLTSQQKMTMDHGPWG
jgi:hypothetical protein